MLKVWGRRSSFNVQKVMWLTGELGLEHEHIDAGGSFGGLDAPEFRARNPHGLVPVIEDGGTVVWESHAILRYLAARYGAGGFWIEDPARRAEADQWIEWAQTALLPNFLTGIFWGFYRMPEAQRNMEAVERAAKLCGRHILMLDRLLADRPYICGNEITLADVPAGTMLYRYFGLEIERPEAPNVEAWYARLRERAPYAEHVMVPFEELKRRLAF
ncbi:glutathione S-transferase family protein [Parvibaculum sp.]|uniref:glutathione S-transferase family protein n=1 Tax=Parvibaculum sp. TaxID=2024848 RepID=UPI001B0E4137|nr:glutathione S-transferase family protein [Parvibaculum sp.]MBO6634080.1 glutathione S-transferase family protein [Parvibaculum sp.]MBO6677497.1 glutathione S-transferase family protein [Parvibaculum sp.]MBO6685242.1 glutathione S-transferase family protein [Parvibaculum sp.]MBO6903459.1 glutathione S-transferase family protein [Parvibaculum sp.]